MMSLHSLALVVSTMTAPQAASAMPAGGAACVALLLPSVEGVEGDALAVAASIRSVFESYLTGPSLKSMPLEARLMSQATEEAKQKACPAILSVTVTRKTSGGGPSKIAAVASAAGTTAAYIPVPNYGTAVAVGAARGGVEAVSSVARGTRAKDEMKFSYKVTTADGAVVVPQKTETVKAKSDGEDLLTPLISRASETVATAVTKK
jgi:hypothetical protein